MGLGESHLNREGGNIFEEYRADLQRYLRKMLSSGEDADDLLQETYSRIYKRVSADVACVDNPRAYIFVTASNLVRDFLRSKLRRQEQNNVSIEDVTLLSREGCPEGAVVSEQLRKDMLSGLECLNPKSRVVFVMHRYQQLTHVQIAEELGVSVRTIERRMKIAVDHFRHHLKDYL